MSELPPFLGMPEDEGRRSQPVSPEASAAFIDFFGAVSLGAMSAAKEQCDYTRRTYSKNVNAFPPEVEELFLAEDVISRELELRALNVPSATFIQIVKGAARNERQQVHYAVDGTVIRRTICHSLDKPEIESEPDPYEVGLIAAFVAQAYPADLTPQPEHVPYEYQEPAGGGAFLRGAFRDARTYLSFVTEGEHRRRMGDDWWALSKKAFPDLALQHLPDPKDGQLLVARLRPEGPSRVEFGYMEPRWDSCHNRHNYGHRVVKVAYTLKDEGQKGPPLTREVTTEYWQNDTLQAPPACVAGEGDSDAGLGVAAHGLYVASDYEEMMLVDALRVIFPRWGSDYLHGDAI